MGCPPDCPEPDTIGILCEVVVANPNEATEARGLAVYGQGVPEDTLVRVYYEFPNGELEQLGHGRLKFDRDVLQAEIWFYDRQTVSMPEYSWDGLFLVEFRLLPEQACLVPKVADVMIIPATTDPEGEGEEPTPLPSDEYDKFIAYDIKNGDVVVPHMLGFDSKGTGENRRVWTLWFRTDAPDGTLFSLEWDDETIRTVSSQASGGKVTFVVAGGILCPFVEPTELTFFTESLIPYPLVLLDLDVRNTPTGQERTPPPWGWAEDKNRNGLHDSPEEDIVIVPILPSEA